MKGKVAVGTLGLTAVTGLVTWGLAGRAEVDQPTPHVSTVTVTPAPSTSVSTQVTQAPLPVSCRQAIAYSIDIAQNTKRLDGVVGLQHLLEQKLPVLLFTHNQQGMNDVLGKLNHVYEKSGSLSSTNLEDVSQLNHLIKQCRDETR